MKDHMLTKLFWTQALTRSVRTFAQTAIATIGVGTTNLLTADLKNILAISTSSAVISLLMSVDRSTSATDVEVVEPSPMAASPELGCGTNLKG